MLSIIFFCPDELLMNAFKQLVAIKKNSYFLMEDTSKMNILTLLYFPSQRQVRNKTSVSISTAPTLPNTINTTMVHFPLFLWGWGEGEWQEGKNVYQLPPIFFSDSSFRRKKIFLHVFSILRIIIRFNWLRVVHLNTVMNFTVPQKLGNFLTISLA